MMDVQSGRWKKVLVTNLQPRQGHCAAAISLSPGITEVVIFGGADRFPAQLINVMADTTVLRFEKDIYFQSEWILKNIADKTQRGTRKRIREKMSKISQLTHDYSETKQEAERGRDEAERNTEDAERKKKEAERNREEAENGRQEAKRDRQEAERSREEAERGREEAERAKEEAERGREEAERGREEAERAKEEAERGREEAERGREEAERGREEAERAKEEAERGKEEAERSKQEVQQRAQDLERRLSQIEVEMRYGKGEKHWLVQRREIHMTNQKLGGGGWGEVKVAEFRGERVAAKLLYRDLQSPYYHDVFVREMNMASRVRSPNLVQFIGASMDGEMVILMELMPTSLRQHLTSNAPAIPSAAFRISVSLEVAKALNYLHLMQPDPIIHRDISSANVLLEPLPNQKWRAKVTDYGSVNLQSQLSTKNPGSPAYSAPESNEPSLQSPKMDIFSYGVLLVEMCTARFPDVEKRVAMICTIEERHWVDLIHQCLQQDSRQRPTSSQIITQLMSWQ